MVLRVLLLAGIRLYQRHLSPRKGFCCAYRVHTGRASCSTLGYRAVRRHGVWRGLGLIRRRTELCGVAHRRYGAAVVLPGRWRRQRGFCDGGLDLGCAPGCDAGCDAGSACPSDLHGVGDLCGSGCDPGGCDSGRRGRHASEREKYVYIPPQVSLPRGPGTGRR